MYCRLFAAILLLLSAFPVAAQTLPDANRRYVERLEGDSARRYLHNLRAKKPRTFERAEDVLRQRGWTPTDRVTVIRTNRHVSVPFGSARDSILRVVDTYDSSAEGEVVSWEWEDVTTTRGPAPSVQPEPASLVVSVV